MLLLQAIKLQLGNAYTLSTAIGPGPWRTNLSYDIYGIFANTDFVNLMAYDLHGPWEPFTGIHGALFSGPNDQTPANVHDSVNLVLSYGVDRQKLILGMPAYGVAFRLHDPNRNGVGAPASDGGALRYNDICQRINSGSLTYRWEEAQRVPYAFAGVEWVGYDNVRSITEKSNYINQHNLGGGMFWAVDQDDHQNSCGQGRFPLITTARNILGW